jgi:hypothetical protein
MYCIHVDWDVKKNKEGNEILYYFTFLYVNEPLRKVQTWGAFAKFPRATITSTMSVCPHVKPRPQIDEVFWNLVFESF